MLVLRALRQDMAMWCKYLQVLVQDHGHWPSDPVIRCPHLSGQSCKRLLGFSSQSSHKKLAPLLNKRSWNSHQQKHSICCMYIQYISISYFVLQSHFLCEGSRRIAQEFVFMWEPELMLYTPTRRQTTGESSYILPALPWGQRPVLPC